jgi:FMN-dependent oxidoreductase (nitrilotriacetate monooxygenase family)
MAKGKRMFHMGWFLGTGFGVYGWDTEWAGNATQDVGNPDLFVYMAQSLERAGFDYMMLEDSSVLPNVFRGTFESSVKDGGTIRFDPMPLIPYLAMATKHIGLIATVSTSFYPPFLAARLLTTLDWVTHGRAGMNLVTSSPHQAAQNYGLDQHVEHDKRYQMADEWAQVVKGLWNTWEPDAVLADEVHHVYADHTKIHTLDFAGEFFKCRGPINLPPGPQREPVICQAGGSGAGREFGARHADTIIAAVRGAHEMKAYREDISQRMLANGRKPSDAKVLYLVHPVLGDTDQEAQDKYDRMLAVMRANTDAMLAGMSYFTSVDFSQFDLDAPFPDLSKNNGHQSTMNDFARSGKTLREAIANHRVQESVKLVGTPDSVAAQMEDVMAEAGGDGFLIAKPVTRRNITEISDALAPALRKRGLIRSSYEWPTFKQNLLAY